MVKKLFKIHISKCYERIFLKLCLFYGCRFNGSGSNAGLGLVLSGQTSGYQAPSPKKFIFPEIKGTNTHLKKLKKYPSALTKLELDHSHINEICPLN